MAGGRAEAGTAEVVAADLSIPTVHHLLTTDLESCPDNRLLVEVLSHSGALVVLQSACRGGRP